MYRWRCKSHNKSSFGCKRHFESKDDGFGMSCLCINYLFNMRYYFDFLVVKTISKPFNNCDGIRGKSIYRGKIITQSVVGSDCTIVRKCGIGSLLKCIKSNCEYAFLIARLAQGMLNVLFLFFRHKLERTNRPECFRDHVVKMLHNLCIQVSEIYI